MARVSALLYGCSSFFVTATIVLPHPPGADIAGLWIVAGVALLASVAIFALSDRFSTGTIHTVLLLGSGLISACVALSGSPSGVYAAMFIWVVLVAARSFSLFGLVFQLLGILATYGVALSTLTASPDEFPITTRWLLSVFALCVTGVISLRLVSDARKKEAELIRMSGMRPAVSGDPAHRSAHLDGRSEMRLEPAPATGNLAGRAGSSAG